jgi:hypothetical protein
MVLIAFIVWFLGNDAFSKEKDAQTVKTTGEFFKPYLGWAILYVILTAGTDFQPTAKLSAGFAGLILLSVLFVYGPDVFEKVSGMLQEPTTQTEGVNP